MKLWNFSNNRTLMGIAVAIGSFTVLGSVAALWKNPLFVRMTPAGEFEIMMLVLMSVLFGIFVAIPSSVCGRKLVGGGGVIGFLGIACPICNKILVLLFGSQLLLTYMEPARLYIAGAGVLMTLLAVVWKLRAYRSTVTA
jgi:hypothetical protein